MKLPAALTGLALFWTQAVQAENPPPSPVQEIVAAEEPSSFIRVVEENGATRLQTAVVRYERDGTVLDLIGAIHIADVAYYQALNHRFKDYQALLYEGVGTARPQQAATAGKEGAQKAAAGPVQARKASLGALHALYQKAAQWLDLSDQMAEIDYSRPNFVHADLSLARFRALQAERGESIVSFMIRSGVQTSEGKIQKPKRKSPGTFTLLKSLIQGDPRELKREIVHSLHASEDQVAAFSGDNVIINDRNAHCLEVLEREIAKGHRKLGIFYGAAHYQDMEKRLLQSGWKRGESEWMTAWNIDP